VVRLSQTFTDVNMMQATAAGCKPLFGDQPTVGTFDQLPDRRAKCYSLMSFVFNTYLPAHRPDALLISARWMEEDLPGLRRTIDWAKGLGIGVVLFGPMVEYDSPLPRLLAVSIQSTDLSLAGRHMLMGQWSVESKMAQLAASENGVKYISLIAPICLGYTCASYTPEGVPLEFDSNHFTRAGSLLIARRIEESAGL
jgi:SGNH domain (fused to AT3 domains)